ncbi:MAG: hypothetical protein FJ295_08000 [Planctomycetes bacterium]|nr:hypothetical protein [Planctomycetota bacterium]
MLKRLEWGLGLITLFVSAQLSTAEDALLDRVVLRAGERGRAAGPMHWTVELPSAALRDGNELPAVRVTSDDQHELPAQIGGLRLSAAKQPVPDARRELTVILPALQPGESLQLTARYTSSDRREPSNDKTARAFRWNDTPGKFADLLFGDRPVLRYMYEKLDETSADRRAETYKPYHHLFDPSGMRLVTKGPGGLFPHHRGLFYGFNRIEYGPERVKADVWHCNRGEFQSHEQVVVQEAGPVYGRHRVRIDWHGPDGKVFAREERELTAYDVNGGSMIEFRSILDSTAGKVRLDGDPQHAGFQFRASQEVPDKTAAQTYYLRPDGAGQPGSFRNWDDKMRDPRTINLPWLGLCFVLGEQRYTCLYLDHADNPKEARYSERDYGRFGSYFEYEIEPSKPLFVNYRLWLQAGELTTTQAEAQSESFTRPLRIGRT